jgi:hypothetical protein
MKMRMNLEHNEIHSHSPTHSHSVMAGLQRQVSNCFMEDLKLCDLFLATTIYLF